MAYGKKRGRSSSARRKSNRKKRVQRGLSRAEKKEVHRIIAGETELKKTESEFTTNLVLSAPTVLDFYQPVIQGVQADERIGDQITIKKWHLRSNKPVNKQNKHKGINKKQAKSAPT